MSDFEIVDPADVPERSSSSRSPSPVSIALAAGKTIFLPDTSPDPGRSKRSYLRSHGYFVHTRRGERNGVQGRFMWADKP